MIELTDTAEVKNKYSPSTNMFYPSDWIRLYISAGTLPDDAADVDDEVYQTYNIGKPPSGKRRGCVDGVNPVWVDIPPPDPAIVILKNVRTREDLIKTAVVEITTLQAGIATNRSDDGDSDSLTTWQNYLCDLRDMTPEDLQQSPVVFPASPASIF